MPAVLSPSKRDELLQFGYFISPALQSNGNWREYLGWATRHLGISTKEEVNVLAFGFQAGWERSRNYIKENI